MLRLNFCLLLIVGLAFAADEAPKLPSGDQLVLDKAIAVNLLDAFKAYETYLSVLAKAQDKVIKGLEKVKGDAMKKGNLPLAIAADAKVSEIKNGGLSQKVVDQYSGDLLGNAEVTNRIIRMNDFKPLGPGSRIDSNYGGLFLLHDGIEFTVSVPEGQYYLHALYAAEDARPCSVSSKNKSLGQGYVKTSGGWTPDHLTTDAIGPFNLAGMTILTVRPTGSSAGHFYGFVLSTNSSLDITIESFKKPQK